MYQRRSSKPRVSADAPPLITEPHLIQVLNRLKVTPNQTQARFLPSWLGRVKAIAYA